MFDLRLRRRSTLSKHVQPMTPPTQPMTPPTPSRKLPAELEDMILDYLHNDRATLKKCTLVCKSWLPTTALHLWPNGSITLRPRPGDDTVEEFLACLSGSRILIPFALRELHINGRIPKCSENYTVISEHAVASILIKLCPYIQAFSLSNLTLSHSNDPLISQATLQDAFSTVKGLRSLSIEYCRDDLRRPDTVAVTPEPGSPTAAVYSQLEQLTVDACSVKYGRFSSLAASIYDCLTEGSKLRSIHFPLRYNGHEPESRQNLDTCGRLLAAVGPTLEHLTLDTWQVDDSRDMATSGVPYFIQLFTRLNLTACTHLSSLNLRLAPPADATFDNPSWAAASAILALLAPHPSLATLKITIVDRVWIHVEGGNELRRFAELDVYAARLSRLRHLKLEVERGFDRDLAPDYVDNIQGSVGPLFERLKAKGVDI